MFKYVLKRILIFIPTLLIISLVVFIMSKLAPGDPVELRLGGGAAAGQSGQLAEKLSGEKAYLDMAQLMGLDKPVFYLNLSTQAFPDSLYKIPKRYERKMLSSLIHKYGNWPQISDYYKSARQLEFDLLAVEKNDENFSQLRAIRESANELYVSSEPQEIERILSIIETNILEETEVEEVIELKAVIEGDSVTTYDTIKVKKQWLAALKPNINEIKYNFANVQSSATAFKRFIPSIKWYGANNQYHRWMFGDQPWFKKNTDPRKSTKGILRGDFGTSYQDGRKVTKVLGEGIAKSMWLSIISIILVYLLSIPLGTLQAIMKDSWFDRISTFVLFILYSLPTFWVATLMVVFITTDEYGMDWFPTFGWSSYPEDANFLERILNIAYHITLPIACLTYGGLAFLSRQMRGGMLSVYKQDYIRTARAKGLSGGTVVWKHAFRNSLIPIITLFASLFPRLIGGSVVLEIIFSIQGMGFIGFQAILGRNWPIVFAVLMFSAVLTLIGILVSDILYGVVDPRISFTKKSA